MNARITVHNDEKQVDSFYFATKMTYEKAARWMESMAAEAEKPGVVMLLWSEQGEPLSAVVSRGGGTSWLGEDVEERGLER